MKRIKWIDNARTIGILLIIIGHTIGLVFGQTIYNAIFIVNVSIFFYISGYLHKDKPIKKVIKSGFVNLLLPYLITSILLIMLAMIEIKYPNRFLKFLYPTFKQGLVSAIYGAGIRISNIGKFQTDITAIGAIWFLPCMFIANILYTCLRKIFDKFCISDIRITIIFVLICSLGFYLTMREKLFLPWSIPASLVSLLFYWSGELLHEYNYIHKDHPLLFFLCLLIWGLSAKQGILLVDIAYAPNPPIAVMGSIAGCYAICYASVRIEKWFEGFSKKFIKLGELSLIVLCTHIIDLNNLRFIRIVDKVYAVLHISNMKIYVMGQIVYRIIFALLSVLIIPNIPVIRSFFMYRKYPLVNRKSKN